MTARFEREFIRQAIMGTFLGVTGALEALEAKREDDFNHLRRVTRELIPDIIRDMPDYFPTYGQTTWTRIDHRDYCYLAIPDSGNYFRFVEQIFSLTEIAPEDETQLFVDPYETSAKTHTTIPCAKIKPWTKKRVDFQIGELLVNEHSFHGKCPDDWKRYVCPLLYFGLRVYGIPEQYAPHRAHISLALLGTPWPPD